MVVFRKERERRQREQEEREKEEEEAEEEAKKEKEVPKLPVLTFHKQDSHTKYKNVLSAVGIFGLMRR